MTNRYEYLLSPKAIREQSQRIFKLCQAGQTQFKVNLDKLKEATNFTVEVIKSNYPKLDMPYHSRWNHFRTENHNYSDGIPLDLNSQIDLTVISVFLDAGAGQDWKYKTKTGEVLKASEGLAVATVELFKEGFFSYGPWQVEAKKLEALTLKEFTEAFQVTESNPLVGIEGRLNICHQLGNALNQAELNCPSGVYKELLEKKEIQAEDVLLTTLKAFNPIWPGRLKLQEGPLGDVWKYDGLNEENYVPFHKLSQWLSYSLIDVLETHGHNIKNIDHLTGLPEYRNGGLFYDLGVIELKNPVLAKEMHDPGSPLIIEWRALTICLLDLLADQVRSSLKLNKIDFPLVKILEGGTWHAGRKIASRLRSDRSPPLSLKSDGTTF